jgi:hypothetical protein
VLSDVDALAVVVASAAMGITAITAVRTATRQVPRTRVMVTRTRLLD